MTESPIFRMPTVFGPQPGPRQRPGGGRWATPDRGRTTSLTIGFRTEPAAVAALLPRGLEPVGKPVVSILVSQLEDLPWLAGRGYRLAKVTVPAAFHGSEDVVGDFEVVTWEDRADPIVSGREELGFNKVFADIAPLAVDLPAGTARTALSWDGFTFLRVSASGLVPSGAPAAPPGPLIHHRYLPAAGDWGSATVDCLTAGGWTPPAEIRTRSRQAGTGSVELIEGTFEQLPTLCHVSAGLARIPVLGDLTATLTTTTGYTDMYDTRTLPG